MRDALRPLATVLLLGCATAAAAAPRPYAPRLSCASLKAAVASAGAVVISTSRSTYDRFVRDGRFCQRSEITQPAWIASGDRAECFVGYTCKEYSRDDWR